MANDAYSYLFLTGWWFSHDPRVLRVNRVKRSATFFKDGRSVTTIQLESQSLGKRKSVQTSMSSAFPIGSMYGIFNYIWVIYRVNVSKYAIHGSYGFLCRWIWDCFEKITGHHRFYHYKLMSHRFAGKSYTQMLHGAGIFTYLYPKYHPVL